VLGALWLPIPELLPQLVPLSMLQALWLVARYGGVDWALLARAVLPLAGAGLLLGILGAAATPIDLRPVLGVVVLALGARELWRGPDAPLPPRSVRSVAFFVAGLLQGLFATGGPPLVWGLASSGLPKTTFRAALVTSLFVLNVGLMTSFAARGLLSADSAVGTAWLLAPMFAGTWLGDRLHHRIDEGRFRTAVWWMLCAGAVGLLLRR
jgi:uncharacterized membrane protein YfcA